MKPNKVVTRSKRSGSSKSSTVESETVKCVKSICDSAREEWFNDKIFDTKHIKHTPKVEKEVPPEGSIACLKCNSVFETVDKLTKHETRKPVGFMQSCCFVFNGSETKTCLLCNSYLFGMNNVLYIE